MPGIELGFYLFTSVKMDVRQLHLHDLLKIYLDTFKELTSKMGYPVQLTQEVGSCTHTLYDLNLSCGYKNCVLCFTL